MQRRRPPPAAETGSRGWGSGQQNTSAAQGTKWTLGAATRGEPLCYSSLQREKPLPPALSEAQTRQAVASGTMKPDEAKVPAVPQASAEKTVELQPEKPRQELPVQRPELPPLSSFARSTQAAVHSLHARWAAEEAAMRRGQPDFDLQNELRSPEMRRLMQLPGMRVRDAYRLVHYDENLRTAAQAVEQGVVERIQQRAARPTENGIRPGGAATVRPDVASMTRAQREALERRVLHGAQIEL